MISGLSGLTIGSLTLVPGFNPETTEYTANTTNDTNKVTATAEGDVEISITLNGEEFENETSATWQAGDNVLVIVASKAGTTSTTYNVTVTKE